MRPDATLNGRKAKRRTLKYDNNIHNDVDDKTTKGDLTRM